MSAALGRFRFADDQDLAGGAATTPSTNVRDMGSATLGDIGAGQGVRVIAVVSGEDFAGGTSVQAVLQDSADNSTFATVMSGPVVETAGAIKGKVLLEGTVPKGMRRYHRLAFTTVGTMTAGMVTAGYMPA